MNLTAMLKKPTAFKMFDRLGIQAGVIVPVITLVGIIWAFAAGWMEKADKKDLDTVQSTVTTHTEQLKDLGKSIDTMSTHITTIDTKQDILSEGLYRLEYAFGTLPPGTTLQKYKTTPIR